MSEPTCLTCGECQQSFAKCPCRPQTKHALESPFPLPLDLSFCALTFPLEPFWSKDFPLPLPSFAFPFPFDLPLGLFLDLPLAPLFLPLDSTRSISIGTGPSVEDIVLSLPKTICSVHFVVEESYSKTISLTFA